MCQAFYFHDKIQIHNTVRYNIELFMKVAYNDKLSAMPNLFRKYLDILLQYKDIFLDIL